MFTTTLLMFTLYIVFGIIEALHPATDGQSFSGRIRNISYMLILLVVGGAVTALIYYFLPWEPRMLELSNNWQRAGVIFAYLFLVDFFFYWYHRAQHTYMVFWQIHELHHADTDLNATTSLRSYWLERPLQALLITTPTLFIVGIDPMAIIIFPIIALTLLVFAHTNTRLHLGIFTAVIVGPQFHRIHHSKYPEHRGKNLTQFFPIIDIIFRTYYHPQPNEFPETGTPTLASDASMKKVLIKPFKEWGRMINKGIKKEQK